MPTEQIKNILKQLHTELTAADAVDDELKTLLRQIDEDIHGLLAANVSGSEKPVGLQDRVDLVAASFEAKHPQVGAIIRDLADKLGKMGI